MALEEKLEKYKLAISNEARKYHAVKEQSDTEIYQLNDELTLLKR